VLGRPLTYHTGGEIGPAYGAARLGRLAVTGEDPLAVCTPPPVDYVIEPDAALTAAYGEKLARYRRLYRQLKEEFARG
jgi:xylulokinase